MALHVLKFGGTSVANTDRIRHVASIIQKYASLGDSLIVVVSAMAGTTNQLVSYTQQICKNTTHPECDVIVSSGEQITAGLVALALLELGLKGQSFLGYQIPIRTSMDHTNAYIQSIDCAFLQHYIDNGIIPVVAGFQGVCQDAAFDSLSLCSDYKPYRITTLGRGGSDTTAVALAAAFNADTCFIYTDVEGVYSADPRIVPNAQKLQSVSYEAMLELAAHGAKVLHNRSVELAMRYQVKLCILSSFNDVDGTYVMSIDQIGQNNNMESPKFISISHTLNNAKMTIRADDNVISNIFLKNMLKAFSDKKIKIDNIQCHCMKNISFLILKSDVESAQSIIREIMSKNNNDSILLEIMCDTNIVTLTIVGVGMNRDAQFNAKIFQLLTDHDISVLMMCMTETTITLAIHHNHMPMALTLLHDELLNFKNIEMNI